LFKGGERTMKATSREKNERLKTEAYGRCTIGVEQATNLTPTNITRQIHTDILKINAQETNRARNFSDY